MSSRSQKTKQQLILKKKIETIVSEEQPESIPGHARTGKRKNLKPITKSFDEADGARESDDGEVFLIPEGVEDMDMTPIKTSFYQYQTSQPMYAHPNLQFGLHWPSSTAPFSQSDPTQDHPPQSTLTQTTPTQAYQIDSSISSYPPQPTPYPTQPSFTQPTPEMLYLHQQQIYQRIHSQQTYGPKLPPTLIHGTPLSPTQEIHHPKLPLNPFSTGNDRYSPDLSLELMNPLPPPVSESQHHKSPNLKLPNWDDVINLRSSPLTDNFSPNKDTDCSSDSPTTPIPGVDSPAPLSDDIQIIPQFKETSPAPPDHADSEGSDNQHNTETVEPVIFDGSHQITKDIQHVIETHFKGSLDHLQVFLDDETILLLYELIIKVKRKTPKKSSKKYLLKNITPLLYKINKKLLLLEDAEDGSNVSRTVLFESLENALPPVMIDGKTVPFSVKYTKGLLKCAMRKVHREELSTAEGALDSAIKEFSLLLEPGEQSEGWDDEIEKLYGELVALKYNHIQLAVPKMHHKECMEQYVASLINQAETEDQPVAWPSDCISLTKLLDHANKHCPLVGKPQPRTEVKTKKNTKESLSELTDNLQTSMICTTNQSTQLRPKYSKTAIPTSPHQLRSTQVVHPQPKVLPPPLHVVPIIPPHPYALIPQQVLHQPGPVPVPIPIPVPVPAAPHHFQNSAGYPDYNTVGRFLSIISPDRRRHSSEKSHRHRSREKRKRSRSRSPSYRSSRRSSERRRYRSSSSERDSRSSKRYRDSSHESDRYCKNKPSRGERKRKSIEKKRKRDDALMEKRNMIKMKFAHHSESKRVEKGKIEELNKEINALEAEIEYLDKDEEKNDALCKEVRELKEIMKSMESLKDEEKKSLIHEQLKQLIDMVQTHGVTTKEDMKITLREEIKELKEIQELNKRKRLRELRAVEDEIEEKKLLELESEVGGLEEEECSKDSSNIVIKKCDKQMKSGHKPSKVKESDKENTEDKTGNTEDKTGNTEDKSENSEDKIGNSFVTLHAKLMKQYGDVKLMEAQVDDRWNVVLTVQGYVFEGVATTEIDAVEDASFKALLLAPYLMTQVKCAG